MGVPQKIDESEFSCSLDAGVAKVCLAGPTNPQTLQLSDAQGSPIVTLDWQRLSYVNSDGRSRELRFNRGRTEIQDGNLMVSELLESVEGVRATACYRFSNDAVRLDVELVTRASVEDLALTMTVHSQAGTITQHPIAEHPSLFATTLGSGEAAYLLLAELGDHGSVEALDSAQVRWVLLRQNLEKGVVLVARVGLLSIEPGMEESQLARLATDWLQEREFL